MGSGSEGFAVHFAVAFSFTIDQKIMFIECEVKDCRGSGEGQCGSPPLQKARDST